MSKKEKPFSKNILSQDDEVMKTGYYQNPKTEEQAAIDEVGDRLGVAMKVNKKPENQKTRKSGKNKTKPRSFNEPVEKIGVEIPKRLVKKMRRLALDRESRFNKELAEAIEQYVRQA